MRRNSKVFGFLLPMLVQSLCGAPIESALSSVFDSRWGNVDIENDPWVYTSGLGWIYFSGETDSYYWFWIQGLGWLNSSKEIFPMCYLVNPPSPRNGGMILLDSTEIATIKYWHFEEREWKYSYRADSIIFEGSEEYFYYIDSGESVPSVLQGVFSKYYSYGAVPDSLVGLKAKNPIPVNAPRLCDTPAVMIGPYYLYFIDNSGYPEEHVFEVYVYNSYDKWFYGVENRKFAGSIRPGTKHKRIRVCTDGENLILETENEKIYNLKIVPFIW